ncbi:hypothetical protein KSP40_PGU001293 [Platanthera guangdongensis]|uniref:Uncharacterized protein n=1 Tax=Platanthera guangdongensis TaxID=2320717 RepID=A0ABR2MMX8_9ASPA
MASFSAPLRASISFSPLICFFLTNFSLEEPPIDSGPAMSAIRMVYGDREAPSGDDESWRGGDIVRRSVGISAAFTADRDRLAIAPLLLGDSGGGAPPQRRPMSLRQSPE